MNNIDEGGLVSIAQNPEFPINLRAQTLILLKEVMVKDGMKFSLLQFTLCSNA